TGNRSCKEVGGAPNFGLGCRRVATYSPTARTSLLAQAARRPCQLKQVFHPGATPARALLSHASHSFLEGESRPLPQLSAASDSVRPGERCHPRPDGCPVVLLRAMNKPRHMHLERRRPQK